MKPKFNRSSRLFLALSALTCALSAPAAFAATETFNTAGTFNWVCPGGVNSVQVECWGGGGAGWAGRKDANTGTNTAQNGGGGGGGAYAKRVAVPVIAGTTYTFTVPTAAVSGSAGTTTNGAGRVNGGTVTFTNNAGVTVTAAGGTGGANAYITGSNTTTAAAGGAGGTTAASVGDVGAVFAGGAGAAGTTGTTGASGSGGGGGGSTAGGSAGTAVTGGTSTAAATPAPGGTGGSIGGGTGGSGFGAGAVSTNFSAGGSGAVAGGGGGGGHNVGQTTRLGGTGGLGQVVLTYTDPPANFKGDNPDPLNLASSWTAFLPNAGNIAEWNNLVSAGNSTSSLGADIAFAGIKISDPGGPVTLNAGNTLTLGAAAIDLDLSAATQDLTVNSALAMSAANVWNVAAPRTLTLGGAVSGSAAITKQGAGTAILSGLNTYSGATTIGAGTLVAAGGSTATALVTVGNAVENAVLNVPTGGTMTGGTSITVGTFSGAVGAVNVTGGTLTTTADSDSSAFGATDGGYGAFTMSSGTFTQPRFMFGGIGGTTTGGAVGVGLISGGTATISNWMILSRNAASTGILTITGGTIDRSTAANTLSLGLSGSGRAELNVAGGTINNAGRNLTFSGGTGGTFHWSGTGLLNLNAGTLATNAVVYDTNVASANASSYVNFSGGTLQATVASASFLPAFTPSGTGINRVFVNGAFGSFAGGATIDTNGFNSTISANLLAPTGNGVTSLSLDSQGSGYVGAPAVKILDDGLPSTATAYAVVDTDSSSANFGKVTNVIITNPGVITGTATVSLVGGGGSGAAISVATTGANTSGGLTKIGIGTLTLNGANTYSGATLVSSGSLVVNGSLGSGAVSIASGTTLGGTGTLGGTVTVDTGTAQITGGDGTSGTLSTQNLTFSGTGVINVGALGNYAINPAIDTPGALTLSGGAGAVTVNLNAAPVASGTYRLVRAASGIADASGFTLGTAPAPVGRQAAGTLQYDSGTNTVTYTTGGTYPIWSGAQSNEWSTNVISPAKNWQLADSSGGTDFIAGDEVRFDNSAAIKTVDISNGDVQPTFANFANTVGNDYILQGINGIAGTGVLLKTGSGKLTVTNTNSHTGGTTISSGILAFANGSLGTIGPITVNGGTLQWDGANTQDISSRLTLASSTTATLDTNGNDVTLASAFGGGTSGGLAKTGAGTLTLSAANTFTGASTIGSGTLKVGNAASLGAGTGIGNGTTISSGATLDLGGVSNAQNSAAGSERLTVSGTGVGSNGALISSTAIATPFIGVRYLTLAGDTTLGFANRWDVGSSTAANNGFVGGGYNLNFLGTAAAAQASLNFLGETDLGDVNVNLGSDAATNILFLQGNTTLGQPGKTVTIIGGSTLDVFTSSTLTSVDKKFDLNNGILRISKTGAMSLPGTIQLTGAGGTITANAAAVAITSSNVISGGGSFTKAGAGTLALAGTNVYTGTTTVSAGSIIVQHPAALGDTTGGTSVATGARVELDAIAVAGEAITLIGNGTNFLGALQSRSGASEWSGNVTIDADGTRIGANNGASLLVSGVIDDGASDYRLMYRVGDAAGSVTISGANTYSGGSSIVGTGPVIVGSLNSVVGGTASSNLGAPTTEPNGRIIMGTTTVNGTLRYAGSGETTDRTIQIGENSTAPVAGDIGSAAIENNGTTGALVFSAPIFNIPTDAVTGTSPARTLTLGGSNTGANTVSGVIQNNRIASISTAAVNVTKTGAGSWTLAGANTYTGATTIDNGTLAFATNDQSLTGGLAFGTANGAASNGTLDLSAASATFAGAAVVRTNSTTPNAISIGATRTLTLSGGLTLGYDAAGGTDQTESMLTVSGLGGMVVNGTTINVSVNQAAVNAGYWNKGTLDVSGLAAFSTDVTTFNIGVGSTTQGPGTVLLSDTANTIIATTLTAGNTGGNNGRGSGLLVLGTGTNLIQADTINIGRSKSVPGGATGIVRFASQVPGSPGTVTIADRAGTGRANIEVAIQGGTATGGGATGTLDLRGHVATVSAGTLNMGSVSAASNTGSPNGTLSFDAGTFDVNTLTMATKSGGSTGTARATVNVGGGTFTVNTAFTMGSQAGAGASLATLNLTGGTLTSSVGIVNGAGTVTSIINLSGGTLDMSGNAIGSGSAAITLNAEAGTLSNVASINATGGLTKTTAGTLLLSGTNTYVGDTTVSEGTLTLSSAPDPLNANTANDASTVTIAATGATLNLTYTGTDKVDKLFIGASQKAAGTYGHTNSGADNGGLGVGALDAYFGPGSGTLTVASGTNFASWIASFGLVGPDALATADPDFDGIANAVEMVIGGNPATVMDTALLPTLELVNADPDGDTTFADYLLFTYRRTDLSVAAGVTANCETDTDLVAPWTLATGAPGVVIQVDDNFTFSPPAAANTDRVRVYVPRGANTTLFGRLNVVVP